MNTEQPIASTSSTTIHSLDDLHTHVPPSVPPYYLTHHIAQTLLRKGFQGAEVGALTEIERLLEHHLHAIFSGSTEFAQLAGRAQPNAFDVLKAREQVENSSVKKLGKEAGKRRPVIKLEKTYEEAIPTRATTLQDLMNSQCMTQTTGKDELNTGIDTKPSLDTKESGEKEKEINEMGVKPSYGFEGVPCLPPKWTYAIPEPRIEDDTPHGQITKRSLDFVKLTASERGDIPAELGLVNFKKQRKRMTAA